MNDPEQSRSMKLIHLAEEIGLFDSSLTTQCIDCNAIFPKEYDKCPQCNTN